jgi:hypothetical protein
VILNGAETEQKGETMKKAFFRISGMLALVFVAAHTMRAQEP